MTYATAMVRGLHGRGTNAILLVRCDEELAVVGELDLDGVFDICGTLDVS